MVQKFYGQAVIFQGKMPHLNHGVMGFFQSQRGGGEEALIQHGDLFLIGPARDEPFHQGDQQAVEGQEEQGASHIEGQVEIGDAAAVHLGRPEGEVKQGVAAV